MHDYTRSEFLKFSCMATAAFLLNPHAAAPLRSTGNSTVHRAYPFGRVLFDGATSRQFPSEQSEPVSTFSLNDVLPIGEPISRKNEYMQRETWFRLEDSSFLRSVCIQPVDNQLNTPLSEVSRYGQLAEITVPFTTAFSRKRTVRKPNKTFYYGSLHWVYRVSKGSDERMYYLVRDDRWLDEYFIDARYLRIMEPQDLAPISPDVNPADKTIHISIRNQMVIAYEKDQPVFTSSMASGLLNEYKDYSTPPGSYKINYKRPSRHMLHSDRVGIYGGELFGVPWVTYFTNTGIAFHGTYWHNDFSKPRSNGCVNLPIPAARWIYLWTLPTVPPREKTYVSRFGTQVVVF